MMGEPPRIAGREESVRVLLAGATGFIGRHVARALAERGHFVSCLVRLGSEARLHLPGRERSERVSGDLTDPESLVRKPLGCDAAVNLVAQSPGSDFWNFSPTRLVVNDAIEACVSKGHLRLRRPDGKDYKTTIVRVERVAALP